MKQTYYAIVHKKKLCSHKIYWHTSDGIDHFVPAIFSSKAEAEEYKMDVHDIVEVNIKIKDKQRFL